MRLSIPWCIIVVFLFMFNSSSQQEPPLLWFKSYGGAGWDYGMSIVQTSDGGFFAAGYKETWYKSGTQLYLIKLNSNGDSLWSKVYGKSNSGDYLEKGYSALQTKDGGFITAGMSYWDVYLVRTDSVGDTLWTKTIGTPNNETGYCVAQTNDNGFIVVGDHQTLSGGRPVVYLIKTDTNGDTVWTRMHMPIYSHAYSVDLTRDGGYIITGSVTDSFYTNTFLLKTDSNGDSLWARHYQHGLREDWGNCVKQTSDGGFIIAGQMERTSANYYISLIRTDSLGDTLWTKSEYRGFAYDIEQTTDGGFILTGAWGDDRGGFFIMRTNEYGERLWQKTFPHFSSGINQGRSVIQTSDGGFAAVGYGALDSNDIGAPNFLFVRIDSEGNTIKKDNSKNKPALSCYNLTSYLRKNRIYLTFTLPISSDIVIDLYGPNGKLVQELYDKHLEAGSNSVEARLKRKLPNGVYIIKLNFNGVVVSKKINLVR